MPVASGRAACAGSPNFRVSLMRERLIAATGSGEGPGASAHLDRAVIRAAEAFPRRALLGYSCRPARARLPSWLRAVAEPNYPGAHWASALDRCRGTKGLGAAPDALRSSAVRRRNLLRARRKGSYRSYALDNEPVGRWAFGAVCGRKPA